MAGLPCRRELARKSVECRDGEHGRLCVAQAVRIHVKLRITHQSNDELVLIDRNERRIVPNRPCRITVFIGRDGGAVDAEAGEKKKRCWKRPAAKVTHQTALPQGSVLSQRRAA